MNKPLSYKVFFKEEPEGGFTVIVPTLPGCITYGETLSEAKENAREAIELYIETLKEDKKEIPSDNKVFETELFFNTDTEGELDGVTV